MKIVIMTDEVFEKEVEPLVNVVQGVEPETAFYPIKRKAIQLPVLEIIIYIAKGLEHVMLAMLLEEGIRWGNAAIQRYRHEPFVITIFGEDGIPLARKKILSSGEIEDVPIEKIPRVAQLPIHLL
jgi:hypothetical protein